VIYTSGSTGKPKGVAIEHRNTVNLLHWAKTVYRSSDLAGVLASTSVCFDLSAFELWVPLVTGGKVIVAENALCLHDLAAKHKVTLLNTVPSVMKQVLALGPLPESVRTVNLAGEPLRADLVNRLYIEAGVDKVYDLYGPSETTTYTTFTLRRANGVETIGRPIANTQIYILDDALQPVAVGVEGELYIGGAGVARGYLNRAELTGERFVPNPFSDDASARLYRTGDRTRYRSDGKIVYLGRVDNQVKIRGYRVELGEIEATLKQHPAVQDNVIVARARSSSGEKDLIGYVIPTVPSTLSLTQLRSFLQQKLPDYMIPSTFVTLDALPLTPNGKIDRSVLPLPDGARPELDRGFVAPRTQIEELVAQAWREILSVETLSIYDNFFKLGGHSLVGTQIVARLRETFGREIPLAALFDAPTVAELSMGIEKLLRDGCARTLPPIVPVPRDGRPIPLSMNQEHLWRLDQMMPGTHFFNMPYVYQFTGDLNPNAVERALVQLVRRHECLRTVFADVGGDPVQIIREAGDVPLPCIDLREESAKEILEKAAEWILKERHKPFDLQSGPLMRARLLRLTESDYLLLVTMHHIISDHWSMQIFRSELNALWSAFSQNRSSLLPEPTLQFADYAIWERKLIDDGVLKPQLQFWQQWLACGGKSEVAVHNRSRKTVAAFIRNNHPIDICEPVFNELKRFAVGRNVTPFVVILSALYALIHLYTRKRDLNIGILVANRHRKGVESVIGHFVNTVVLPIHIPAGMTFEELLTSVREGVFAMQDNQDLPFEALVRVAEMELHLKRENLFQVLVGYNSVNSTFDSAGPSFAPVDFKDARSVKDITVTNLDVIFRFLESPNALSGSVSYRKALLRTTSRDAVNEYLCLLIDTILSQTSAPISSVSFYRGLS
jgi:acyl carrier protein